MDNLIETQAEVAWVTWQEALEKARKGREVLLQQDKDGYLPAPSVIIARFVKGADLMEKMNTEALKSSTTKGRLDILVACGAPEVLQIMHQLQMTLILAIQPPTIGLN